MKYLIAILLLVLSASDVQAQCGGGLFGGLFGRLRARRSEAACAGEAEYACAGEGRLGLFGRLRARRESACAQVACACGSASTISVPTPAVPTPTAAYPTFSVFAQNEATKLKAILSRPSGAVDGAFIEKLQMIVANEPPKQNVALIAQLQKIIMGNNHLKTFLASR